MNDARQLLADYARTGSETAFRELVRRYLDFVYSSAVRLVGGDRHLAQDVAQVVFIRLAQKARRLSPEILLGGWLHRATCHAAATAMRSERRRRTREEQAAQMNALQNPTEDNLASLTPLLDKAIEQLRYEDRTAILLRFFEQREFASVGQALGIGEDGARKRVARALQKLQSLLKRQGIGLSAAALGTILGAEAVTAAPAGLAASIAGTALAGAAMGGTSLTLVKILTMTKLQISALGAIIVASVATPLVWQYQANAKLRQANQALQHSLEQLGPLAAQNEVLSNALARSREAQPPVNEPSQELLRLRGEVGRWRKQAQEMEEAMQTSARAEKEKVVQDALKLKDREAKLKELVQQMPARAIPEFYLLGDGDFSDVAKGADLESEEGIRAAFYQLRFRAMNQFAAQLQPVLRKYVDENDGQPPQDANQLASYFDPPIDVGVLPRYTVLHSDTNHVLAGWNGGWVLTQREPVDGSDSRWYISPVGFQPGQFDGETQPQAPGS